jgi:hypothetical protein
LSELRRSLGVDAAGDLDRRPPEEAPSMTPLLMTLALSAGQPPVPLPPGTPVPYPGRPAYYPGGRGPFPGQPVFPPPHPGWPAFYPPVVPPVAPPVFVPPRKPPTLEEFVRCFKPVPGTHQVVVLHPVTCRPVRVCFTLPDGCGCPKVKSGRRWVEFDYGRREVEINFWRDGTVGVNYH